VRLVGGLFSLILLGTGCTSGSAPTTALADAGIVGEAQKAGASDTQLAILRDGEVSFAEYQRAGAMTRLTASAFAILVAAVPPGSVFDVLKDR
jgi:hypothetical protein